MDRGARRAAVHRVAKSFKRTHMLSLPIPFQDSLGFPWSPGPPSPGAVVGLRAPLSLLRGSMAGLPSPGTLRPSLLASRPP